MSKAIKWQIPFVSTIDKIQYRIDIYAEGYTGTPIQLTGGTTPIKTEENKSDDFFAPVRGQTGTIEVVTKLPNGGTLDINDMLPANNIDHPVRLVSISGSTETIEWQGFMSCEAFSQNYTSVPDIFSFPIISVLEAMASVQADPAMLSGLNNVGETIQQLLEIFIKKAGVSYFSQYYIPTNARGRNILSKYIDATVLYEQKEYNNENSTTYIVSGLSLQDCLARIATYMGWCCREVSASLFFFAATESSGYMRYYRLGEVTQGGQITIRWLADFNYTAVVSRDIAALLWAGVDHKRSVQQGAKSVEVVAKLEKYEVDIEIPPCPLENINEYLYNYQPGYDNRLYLIAYNNPAPTQYIEFGFYSAILSVYTQVSPDVQTETMASVQSSMLAGNDKNVMFIFLTTSHRRVTAGAFLSKVAFETGQHTIHDTNDGLYCVLLPTLSIDTEPIAKIGESLGVSLFNGYLKLTAQMINMCVHNDPDSAGAYVHKYESWSGKLRMHIKVGDKYWDGSQWTTASSIILVDTEGSGFKKNWGPSMHVLETDGYLIPIDATTVQQTLSGKIEIGIYPRNEDVNDGWYRAEVFFSSLNIDYIPYQSALTTDRSENHYFRLLGTNFRDEVSINTELASSLNNQPSPSLIMNSETEAMTELNYGTTQAPDMRRPEVDLLNRLAAYYSAARQRLNLIVEHPTAAPLPLLRLNGISPDNRKYLPLAESRDWKGDTCTLTCFEVPDEQPSES